MEPSKNPSKLGVAQCLYCYAGNAQPQKVKSNGSPGQVSGWSSDQESDSDDSLQPFDLAEEDDDGEHN